MTNETINTTDLDPRDALATIKLLTTCDCSDAILRASNNDCRHFLRDADLRTLLIDRTDIDLESDAAELLRDLLTRLIDAPYYTDELSRLALDYSLCPIHFCDYAICFDDDDPDCAQLRACFPSHDT